MTVDHLVFDAGLHSLPVSERKSRSNAFSIFSRCISYACSATTSRGAESFLGRPLGRNVIPAAAFLSFSLSRVSNRFTTYLSFSPNSSAISLCVFPSDNRALMSGKSFCTFSYFLGIVLPPDVVLLFSYIRGFLSIVRFYRFGSHRPVREVFFCLLKLRAASGR